MLVMGQADSLQPHDQIPLFSMQDMRCFQHFMLRCFPLHPLGNEDVWTHEVPCLSHSVSLPSSPSSFHPQAVEH